LRILSDIPFPLAPVPGRIGFPGYSLSLLVKGTFDLHPGAPATPSEVQLWPSGDLCLPGDEDRDGPLYYPSDFVPLKPAADLLLVGTCWAPGGAPVERCRVAFEVGPRRRTLLVSGDRHWVQGGGRAVPSRPQPFASLPIDYRRSLGGPGSAANPLGLGLADVSDGRGGRYRPVPNLEEAQSAEAADHGPVPAGLGPISPLWAPRLAKLGTFDADYARVRWPWLPEDMDWGTFNAAPAAQQVPDFLKGDEPLVLENLHASHPRYEGRLPGLRPRVFFVRSVPGAEGRFEELPLRLDTLWIDADLGRLVLVWRGWTPVADPDWEEIAEVYAVAEPLSEGPLVPEHYRDCLARRLAGLAAQQRPIPAPAPLPEGRPAPADSSGPGATPHQPGSAPLDRASLLERAGGPGGLAGADLSGLDLSGIDLSGVSLAGARLCGANLTGATLVGADLSGATLAGADLSGAQLAGARLLECDLSGASLSGADASGADLSGALAEGCSMRQARLYRAKATGAYLVRADLGECRARGIALDGAHLGSACLDGADLRRGSLRGARLYGASAQGVLLDLADLAGARFSEGARFADASLWGASGPESIWSDCDLSGADLSYASLPESDLSGARLVGAELKGADLAGARLRKASLTGAHLVEANLFQACLERADLRGADLSGANLYGAELLGARLDDLRTEGANLRRTSLEGRVG
jgi:uncharacterized protein YjbI with pentapeptide repeats